MHRQVFKLFFLRGGISRDRGRSGARPGAHAINRVIRTCGERRRRDGAVTHLKSLSRTRVEVKDDGWTLTYEGVLVGEILKRAGVQLDPGLRGDAIATYVVVSATDGYQVVPSAQRPGTARGCAV